MAYYKYEARNTAENLIVRDTIEADNPKDAMNKLRDNGLVVLHIEQSFTKPGEVPYEPEKSPMEKIKDRVTRFLGKLMDL